MSQLSRLLDRVSGRNRTQQKGEPTANLDVQGGTPYPNAQTVRANGNGGTEGVVGEDEEENPT